MMASKPYLMFFSRIESLRLTVVIKMLVTGIELDEHQNGLFQ
jgi:hypothetical protein